MFVKKIKNQKQKGFTLIEMIIAVVIIGILAGITITVINIPLQQRRSRDARRIADLKMVQSALELYFSDKRSYPGGKFFNRVSDVLNADLVVSGYVNELPKDPRDGLQTPSGSVTCGGDYFGKNIYAYRYKSNDPSAGTKYVLMAIMETKERASESLCRDIRNCESGSGITCGDVGDYCYCVQNPM
jgi:prepilin-type N-terminal cleavage/methylation domain-containing protein